MYLIYQVLTADLPFIHCISSWNLFKVWCRDSELRFFARNLVQISIEKWSSGISVHFSTVYSDLSWPPFWFCVRSVKAKLAIHVAHARGGCEDLIFMGKQQPKMGCDYFLFTLAIVYSPVLFSCFIVILLFVLISHLWPHTFQSRRRIVVYLDLPQTVHISTSLSQ